MPFRVLPVVVLVFGGVFVAAGCQQGGVAERAAGEVCSADGDCASGACAGGFCEGGGCDKGQCDEGWTCVAYHGFLSSGDSCERTCQSDEDCPSTWGCTEGYCSYPRPLEFTVSGPGSGSTAEVLEFNAEVRRSIGAASYAWDVQWSDGDSSDPAEPTRWTRVGGDSATLEHAFAEPGYWLVRATVSDGAPRENYESQQAVNVVILSGVGQACRVEDPNVAYSGANCEEGFSCYAGGDQGPLCYPPLQVTIASEFEGWKIPAGESTHFEAQWTKVDPDPALTFAWLVDGESVGEGTTLNYSFPEPGSNQLRLVADDEVGRTAEDSIELTICAKDGMACDEDTVCCGTDSWCRLADAMPTCY